MVIKKVAPVTISISYFTISWFFPWEEYQWDSSISISYLFDFIFISLVALTFKKIPNIKVEHQSLLPGKLIATFAMASFVIFLNGLLAIETPFRFIDKLAIQLLVLAPIIEELVFRFAFFHIFKKFELSPTWQMVVNAGLFSLSHLPAMWTLPSEFQVFVGYQVLYTFALGWVCTKAKMRHKSIIIPVLMHFVFNLTFYVAIKSHWI